MRFRHAGVMQPPTRTDPPYVPPRAWGRPVRRTPRAAYLAGAAILVIAVAVALVHRPSHAERASDLQGFLQVMNADIESCAGGVGESLTALRLIEAGRSHDVPDAITIAGTGASNCSPANNELIDDLEGYEVPESLASFHLQDAVTGLVSWAAPDAEQVQADVAGFLAARSSPAKDAAHTALTQAIRKLDAQRTAADSRIGSAITSLAVRAAPPRLPG
jgi:hypothetical protein